MEERGVVRREAPATTGKEATSRLGEVLASLVGVAVSYALAWLAWRAAKASFSLLEGEVVRQRVPEACGEWLSKRYAGGRPVLSEHELILARCVVGSAQLRSGLEDVGGLEEVVEEIRDLVVLPLARPEMFATASKLVRAPRGVLLYGEPGTGKSLLARAVARDSGAALLNVRASTLSDKFFGESNKLVAAMFSLAAKLAPAIVFLDEVDGVLAARRASDADVTLALRAEFMTHLDGLLTEDESPHVIVLAATNRPYDLDPAVLRRLSRQFRVGLPDLDARLKILTLLLRAETCDLDLAAVARATPGYSGSDLEELCRAAATKPLRDLCRLQAHSLPAAAASGEAAPPPSRPRPITDADFADALRRVKPTAHQALEYRAQQQTPIFADQPHGLSPEID